MVIWLPRVTTRRLPLRKLNTMGPRPVAGRSAAHRASARPPGRCIARGLPPAPQRQSLGRGRGSVFECGLEPGRETPGDGGRGRYSSNLRHGHRRPDDAGQEACYGPSFRRDDVAPSGESSENYVFRWLLTCRAHGLVTQPPSAASGTCEQILDGFADLHELIQTGRLEDELGNPFSYISVGAPWRAVTGHTAW